MKTTFFKMLLIAVVMGIPNSGRAQALIVKGRVKNADNQKTTAYYTLYNSYELLQVGKCSDLKLKLGYNDCYTLTFSKQGCRSKTITISTFGQDMSKVRISFTVKLNPLIASDMQEPELMAGKIYYNKELMDYTYMSCCDQETQEPEVERLSNRKVYYVLK